MVSKAIATYFNLPLFFEEKFLYICELWVVELAIFPLLNEMVRCKMLLFCWFGKLVVVSYYRFYLSINLTTGRQGCGFFVNFKILWFPEQSQRNPRWELLHITYQQDRCGSRGVNLWIKTPYPSGVPGRSIRASVRPAGLTQGELVLWGKGCLRPTASDTHQTWGGAIVGYFLCFWHM